MTMTIDLRLAFEVIGGILLIYTFARTLRTDSQTDVEKSLRSSDPFGKWLRAEIESAFARSTATLVASLNSDSRRIAHEVFTERLFDVIRDGTFVDTKDHAALSKRIDDLAAAINNLSAVVSSRLGVQNA